MNDKFTQSVYETIISHSREPEYFGELVKSGKLNRTPVRQRSVKNAATSQFSFGENKEEGFQFSKRSNSTLYSSEDKQVNQAHKALQHQQTLTSRFHWSSTKRHHSPVFTSNRSQLEKPASLDSFDPDPFTFKTLEAETHFVSFLFRTVVSAFHSY